jgi:UDP-N-acetylglucosamine 2-epimerase (non-hydrolysing)
MIGVMSTRLTRVLAVVGARPNFMKMAPLVAELKRRADTFDTVLVHTGQHYDDGMSGVFLQDLGVGEPDFNLGVGSGSHATQTARVMERLEGVLVETAPRAVLVAGDVNSTLGAALTAAKLEVPVGHVEAGLRSFDRSMPEEINRLVTDAVSDLLFVHSPEAVDNLLQEGSKPESVYMVGNTMIDTLVALRTRIEAARTRDRLGMQRGDYVVVTLHRPSLVDGPLLADAMAALGAVSQEVAVVFPVHPRTRAALSARGISIREGVKLLEPLGYVDFMSLVVDSAGVITDSGGIQEETTFLGIPCFTLRANTERPVTCTVGTNTLLGLAPERIAEVPRLLAEKRRERAGIPELWDGAAAQRIVDVLAERLD